MRGKISVAVLVLIVCAMPCSGQLADVDSLLASVSQDTVLVLVEYVEDLEMMIELQDLERSLVERALNERISELEKNWFEKIIADPRLWFILGAAAGISVAEAR